VSGRAHVKLTARDYKKTTRRPLDFSRYKEFGAGLLVGVVACSALFIYMADAKNDAPDEPRPEARRAATAEAETDATAAAGESGDSYDFYEMLPNFEVVVPEKDRDVKRNRPAAPTERPGVYVLQAGSYRNLPDAERVQQKLSRLGIDAKLQRVAVDNDVWHRVRIGPISDLSELNGLRKQLQAADVDGLVIRVGD
jgi:cell division protein FtsN